MTRGVRLQIRRIRQRAHWLRLWHDRNEEMRLHDAEIIAVLDLDVFLLHFRIVKDLRTERRVLIPLRFGGSPTGPRRATTTSGGGVNVDAGVSSSV